MKRRSTLLGSCLAASLAMLFSAGNAAAQSDGGTILLPVPEAGPPPSVVNTRTDKDKYEDGTPRIERTVTRYSDDSLVSNGDYREYYRTGTLFVEGSFSKGRPDGEWVYYHPTGELTKKVTFKKGQPDGKVEVLRADGTTLAEREYAAGKRAGVWKTYAEGGEQVLQEQSYANGKADGVWKTWFEDGTLQREVSFKAGERDGVSTEWDESGTKRGEVSYKAGKRDGPSIRWSSTGEKTERTYKAGKLVP